MLFASETQKHAWGKLAVAVLAVAGAFILGRIGVQARLPALAVVLILFVTLSISFVRGTDGLYLVIFAMLFSPELATGIATGRTSGEGGSGIAIRLEDLMMLTVVTGWILRSAYMGRRFGIPRLPANSAIWAYMAASILATLFGLFRGSVRSLPAGLINNLKYFEYFLLYFMILAHVREGDVIKRMVRAILFVFFLAMLYGYTQIGSGERVCAPFDAEPNTFGGYIVLLMCVAAGIALENPVLRVRGTMIALLAFAVPPLLFTLSRASYLALIVALLSFMLVSRQRMLLAAVTLSLLAVALMGMPLLPDTVRERISGTFVREREYHVRIAGVDFDSSSSARIISYQEAAKKWLRSPIFGHGVTGTHFIDGQYPRLLVETGVVGLFTFLLIFFRLLRETKRIYREAIDPFFRGTAMGFLCGTMAMLAHGVAANSFIIIRIAEPFWLMAGLVALIPTAESAAERPADEAPAEAA